MCYPVRTISTCASVIRSPGAYCFARTLHIGRTSSPRRSCRNAAIGALFRARATASSFSQSSSARLSSRFARVECTPFAECKRKLSTHSPDLYSYWLYISVASAFLSRTSRAASSASAECALGSRATSARVTSWSPVPPNRTAFSVAAKTVRARWHIGTRSLAFRITS